MSLINAFIKRTLHWVIFCNDCENDEPYDNAKDYLSDEDDGDT